MSALIPFAFDAHAVRVLDVEDAPWFVASDIAAALEYRIAGDMTRMLDDDEKGTQIVRTLRGDQELLVINESGLFSAILRSRKPEARRFRRWVTAEVLPTLRRTGQYGQRDWVAEREQLLGLVAAIRAEADAGVRQALHGQLDQFCRRYALSTPALAGIAATAVAGRGAAPADPALAKAFRDAVLACLSAGASLDHSRDAALAAYSLPQVRAVAAAHGRPLPAGRSLCDALRADPRFVAARAVNSKLTGRTAKCWVFRVEGQA